MNYYNLNNPVKTFKLPKDLDEISGLVYHKDQTLLAVQDENGLIFAIDSESGEIKRTYGFGEDGDYEGITLAGDQVWVLKSNGNLTRLKKLEDDAPRKVFKTHLSKLNDTEGLAYDVVNNRLLVVCKESPGKKIKKARAIYGFDLSTHKLSKTPVVLIDLKKVRKMLDASRVAEDDGEVAGILAGEKGGVILKPSGIAIHPVSGDLYLLSTVPQLLLILSATGRIKSVNRLNPERFEQPEGIAFDECQNLYISNERVRHSANILKFSPQ
jgi:uncharacterized protein YjiK